MSEKGGSLTTTLWAVKFVFEQPCCFAHMFTLADLKKLKDAGSLDARTASLLAMAVADLVISQYRDKNVYSRDAVALLCEITSNEDPEIARAVAAVLFADLIERLSDSFNPDFCPLYDRIFAQVIDFYRHLSIELDKGLNRFGLLDEADLLDRKYQIHKPRIHKSQISNLNSIKKAVFLSRVTIGADVAVTSVIIAKLRELLPNAEFVLLGSRKLMDLFDGDMSLKIREIAYERSGTVISRLNSWLDLLGVIEDEQRGLNPDEFWLIDPDSRLSQLGMLPLIKDEKNYFFFDSRSYQHPGASRLGELAWLWVNETFGSEGPAFPFVALPAERQLFGRAITERLRGAGASNIITVSLGTGGNPRKRLNDSFEEELIYGLLKRSTLILDKGATEEEREQINRIARNLRKEGRTIVEVTEQNAQQMLKEDVRQTDLLTWDGGIGAFAALIAASDQYVGYDSAGQHIAAALGVPTKTIFVNSGSQTFAERWRPYGPGVIEVIDARC